MKHQKKRKANRYQNANFNTVKKRQWQRILPHAPPKQDTQPPVLASKKERQR